MARDTPHANTNPEDVPASCTTQTDKVSGEYDPLHIALWINTNFCPITRASCKICNLVRIEFLGTLRANVEQNNLIFNNTNMTSDQIANHLQILRRKSGFSQDELAVLLGIVTESQVSRHERSESVPGLLAALGYEAFFNKPISEIFPGFYRTVSVGIEERLLHLERLLQDSSIKGREAEPIARKLEFMSERRNTRPSNACET